MKRKITKSKIIVAIIALVMLFIPATINQPKQTDSRSLVIAVGVDLEDDQYVLSTQTLLPEESQTFKETLEVFSAKGYNMLECVQNLSLQIGKITGFGNASAIVFGNDVAEQGIADVLDFFMRSKRLNDNATVVTTNLKAKDLLDSVAKIDKSFAYSINNLIKLNKSSIISESTTMFKFLSDYYSGNKASFVSRITMETDENEGISTDQSGDTADSTTANASVSQKSENMVISNNGQTSVFVGGKQVAVLNPEDMYGFNNLAEQKHAVYTLFNVNDEHLKNAEISMSVKAKILDVKYDFHNGIPRVFYNLSHYLKVEQILQDGNSPIVLNSATSYVSETVKKLFTQKLKTQIAESINFCKEINADLFGVQQSFNKFKHKQWQEYIAKLPNKDDSFKNIEFFVDIQVYGNI